MRPPPLNGILRLFSWQSVAMVFKSAFSDVHKTVFVKILSLTKHGNCTTFHFDIFCAFKFILHLLLCLLVHMCQFGKFFLVLMMIHKSAKVNSSMTYNIKWGVKHYRQ